MTVILCDSISATDALTRYNNSKDIQMVRDIISTYKLLPSLKKDIIFEVVLLHTGPQGNEVADGLAKGG